MNKAISYLLIIFISILILGSFPNNTRACTCAEPSSVQDTFEWSTVVFSGKVIDVKEKRSFKSVIFEVKKTWKSVNQTQIKIATAQDEGACGYDFIVGQEYLVYAKESTSFGKKLLVADICNGTNKLSSSQEDLMILGEGQPPTEKVDLKANQFKEKKRYLWGAAFLAAGLGMIFVFMRRKKTN